MWHHLESPGKSVSGIQVRFSCGCVQEIVFIVTGCVKTQPERYPHPSPGLGSELCNSKNGDLSSECACTHSFLSIPDTNAVELALSSSEETLCPLQLLFAEYFVTATVTKLEHYAVDNIGQAHLQGWATDPLEMHAACVLCKKKTRTWKKKILMRKKKIIWCEQIQMEPAS